MIRHCVLIRFAPGTPDEAIEALRSGIAALPAAIDAIESYWVGPDLGLRDTNADFAVVADFADADAFRSYVNHPAHVAVVDDLLTPIAAARTAVQFTW